MATLAEQVQGERMARIALSMIAEPNDPTTGYVLTRHGGVETLRLIESDDEVPGLARAAYTERMAEILTEYDVLGRPITDSEVRLRMIGYRPRRRAGRPGSCCSRSRSFWRWEGLRLEYGSSQLGVAAAASAVLDRGVLHVLRLR